MGSQWNPNAGFQLLIRMSMFLLLILLLHIHQCRSLNLEGAALLEFRANVTKDPYGVLESWNPNDTNPCTWFGVRCVNGKIRMLDLNGFSLEGTSAPELGNLGNLRSLILQKNQFTGYIPKEFGGLKNLEILDLRANNLEGTIPVEIGQLQSLKQLLLCNNKFQGSIPQEVGILNMLSEVQFDEGLTLASGSGISCPHRKFGH